MSVRLMADVWDRAPVRGADLLLLLAVADYANDEGYLWPSPIALSRKARCARETAWRFLTRCERAGVLERVDLSAGRAQGWRLHIGLLGRLAPTVEQAERGLAEPAADDPAGPGESESVTTDHAAGDGPTVTTDHSDRDDRSRSSVTTDHKEPSGEPSRNHPAPPEPRDDADGALPGMPEPADPPITSAVVVAAYVEAYAAPRGHRPPRDVLGQVGRDAKRLLADGAVPPDKILAAARSAGGSGWRSITTEANRLGARPQAGPARRVTIRHDAAAGEGEPAW